MMRGFLTLLLLVIANNLSVTADGHPRRIRNFTNRQLATTTLTDFSRGDDGFVWIGTGTGLLRFDGSNFDSFFYDDANPRSLSDNRVNKLLHDSHSRLWVATCEGLNLYNPDSDDFTRVSLPGIEFNGYISDLCECSDGTVAFVAAGIGVYKVSPSDSILSAVKIELPGGTNINSIVESSSRKLVCGTHGGTLMTVDDDGSVKIDKITDGYIRFLISRKDGDILVFCSETLLKWRASDGTISRIEIDGNTFPTLTSATLRKDGSIIAAAEKQGIFVLAKNGNRLEPERDIKIPASTREAHISALYEDSEQNLWIGVPRYGAIMAAAEEPDYEHIDISEATGSLYTGPILTVADEGTLWCGLSDGRLLNIDRQGNIKSTRRFSNAVTSLLHTADGRLLAGIDHEGLYEINASSGKDRLIFRPEGKYQGSSIASDSHGNIYFGVLGGGVAAVDSSTGTAEMLPLGNKGSNLIWVSSLFCDSRDRLWIGMYGSLAVYDTATKEIIHLSQRYPQLCKGVHNSIGEDANGNVWSATSNGVYIINPEDWSYRHLSVKDGLPDMFLSSIAFDTEGNAWIGCHEEIAQVDSAFHIRTHKFRGNIDDFGFSCSTINQAKVILSGNRGVTVFDPARLNPPHAPSKPSVSGLFLDGNRITKNSFRRDGKPYLTKSGEINLSHDNGNLTIRLAGKDFTRGENRTYMWCMPGMYDSWTQLPSGISTLALPHLPPGTHSIQIKAKEDTLESEPLEVTVIVSAPWYLTLTAKIIYAILIFAIPLLAWLYYMEKKRQRIKQEKIKYIVDTTEEMWQPVMKGNDEKLIKRISDTVNENLHDSAFNVEKLGEEVGMSRAHLNRKMKELFGMSPSEFLRNARMKQACELLKNDDLDISQVAFRVGFCTQAHFANSFKRFTGMPPSDYRASQKGD
ncbi:MAG: helix-turn-helix domain-containing protein [Bacteroides sp.]|nr:helix-turn-helix domain-containing protein [Bacteroides sp.]MCM1389164.1 helix-turn-helix domain-containing protein [Bacteroides sp.]